MFSIIPIIGNVIDSLLGIVSKNTTDKDLALKIKAAVKQAAAEINYNEYNDLINTQVKSVVAEEQGKSWLQRNWRPMLMVLFGIIILNNYIIAPYIQALVGAKKAIMLPIPPEMWTLLKLGISGYIVGRSAEKIATTVSKLMNNKSIK